MSYTNWEGAHPAARVAMGADGSISLTGGATWDTWTTASWVTDGLVDFTHSSGVLTYTGLTGRTVTVVFLGTMITTTSGRNVSAGISVNNANPATEDATLVNLPQTYPRAGSCAARVTLTNGDTLRVKFNCAASDTLVVSAGGSMTVGV